MSAEAHASRGRIERVQRVASWRVHLRDAAVGCGDGCQRVAVDVVDLAAASGVPGVITSLPVDRMATRGRWNTLELRSIPIAATAPSRAPDSGGSPRRTTSVPGVMSAPGVRCCAQPRRSARIAT